MSKNNPKTTEVELSVVMPCLNEADTLEICIIKAQKSINNLGIVGEIIVADNGSTDASRDIAKRLGATIVNVQEKGYGSALMGGISAANGKYVIMGDADDSYDFLEIPKFVKKLRLGFEIVQGCRLPAGGGTVKSGAMPFLHRWWGNPMFTFFARTWFRAPIHDIYCGLRGFTKEYYLSLNQQCTGMEFATEMIIKSSLIKAKMAEVPITLHPDGRKAHAPHLKTFRDGWRTLRFFLLYSPRQLFLFPGLILILAGLAGFFAGLAKLHLFGDTTIGAHTLVLSSLAILCGYQTVWFAIFAKTFAINEQLMPEDKRLIKFFRVATLERGIAVGSAALISGIGLISYIFYKWYSVEFGNLSYEQTMPWAISGMTLVFLGFVTILSSFFVSLLGMKRKSHQYAPAIKDN